MLPLYASLAAALPMLPFVLFSRWLRRVVSEVAD